MTPRCGCVLPFYLTDTPVQCGCGRWYAATTFHDHELGHVWRGWDVMPDPRSACACCGRSVRAADMRVERGPIHFDCYVEHHCGPDAPWPPNHACADGTTT